MEQRVIEVVKSCMPKDGMDVFLETNIQMDLQYDSLDILMLFNELETEFGITIQNEDVKSIRTVGDIVEKLRGETK